MAWPHRRGTMFEDPDDPDFVHAHYHGSSPLEQGYLSYDGYERFMQPADIDMHRSAFDVPGNPYQPPFACAYARDLEMGGNSTSAPRLGLSVPGGSGLTYGDGWSGGPEGRNHVGMSFDQQLAQGPGRGYGYPQRYGTRWY